MIRAITARRARCGLAAVAASALLLTGSASAAVPADGDVHAAGRSMQTLFDMVRVFASPDSHTAVMAKLTGVGTALSVACWTSGSDYKGISIWYQVTAPTGGYVPAFNIAAHFAPAANLPHCLVPSFSTRYYALEANLRIRTAPTVMATISGYLVNVGSKVIVNCYDNGSPIFGDPVWYHATSPATGYVAGRY